MIRTLITGGARSGKSRRAEEITLQCGNGRPIYIATAQALDDEMRARIARHRADRGPGWIEREEPLDLTGTLRSTDGAGPRLVDCLTLWLSNVMLAGHDPEAATLALAQCLGAQQSPVIVVSNEVGLGLVPETPLGRAFRDAQGRLNQKVAQAVDRVEFVVAGIPMRLKG